MSKKESLTCSDLECVITPNNLYYDKLSHMFTFSEHDIIGGGARKYTKNVLSIISMVDFDRSLDDVEEIYEAL